MPTTRADSADAVAVADLVKEHLDALEKTLIESLFSKLKEEYDQRINIVLKENDELKEANKQLMERLDRFLDMQLSAPPTPEIEPEDDEVSFTKEVPMDLGDAPYDYEEITGEGERNILILSDSIFRHVGVACPKELSRTPNKKRKPKRPIIKEFQIEKNIYCKKVIYPGGNCGDLLACAAEAAKLDPNTIFDEVILHVGTNTVESSSPTRMTTNLQRMLMDLTILFPDSDITYSAIIPRCGGDPSEWINDQIADINYELERYCMDKGFGFFSATAFRDLYKRNINYLYARDGTHLGRLGIENMQLALRNYLKFTYLY